MVTIQVEHLKTMMWAGVDACCLRIRLRVPLNLSLRLCLCLRLCLRLSLRIYSSTRTCA